MACQLLFDLDTTRLLIVVIVILQYSFIVVLKDSVKVLRGEEGTVRWALILPHDENLKNVDGLVLSSVQIWLLLLEFIHQSLFPRLQKGAYIEALIAFHPTIMVLRKIFVQNIRHYQIQHIHLLHRLSPLQLLLNFIANFMLDQCITLVDEVPDSRIGSEYSCLCQVLEPIFWNMFSDDLVEHWIMREEVGDDVVYTHCRVHQIILWDGQSIMYALSQSRNRRQAAVTKTSQLCRERQYPMQWEYYQV